MLTPFTAIRERLVEATVQLVRIPSVTGDEREIANHVEGWARDRAGVPADDIIRLGNNLVIGQPDDQRPCIALLGHLDTVPPPAGGLTTTVGDGRIFGRGAADMKGGVALMQTLLETVDTEHLPFRVLAIFYDREEGPYAENGLGVLLERLDFLRRIDLAIALEPTNNTLQLGCLGALHARVTFRGRAAHSARPWLGENAVHKAAALLHRLQNQPVREVDVNGLRFRESMSATLANGGSTRNVIPDRFELNINCRFAPRPDPRAAIAAAEEEVTAMASDAEVEIVDVAPPAWVPMDNSIVEHLIRTGGLTRAAKEAWTDVGRLAAHGVDAVNFGPGDPSLAHQDDESIDIEALARGYEVLHRALATPLSGRH